MDEQTQPQPGQPAEPTTPPSEPPPDGALDEPAVPDEEGERYDGGEIPEQPETVDPDDPNDEPVA